MSTSTGADQWANTQELLSSTFECVDRACTSTDQKPTTIKNNPCGPNGKCVAIGGNVSGTKCECEGLFAGPHCEFGTSSTYTSNQLAEIYAVTKNSTNYPIFLQSIMTSNSALNNDFYEQYWKDAIKSFFQQAGAKGLTKDKLTEELRDLFRPPVGENQAAVQG
jgi:hypothetical protein